MIWHRMIVYTLVLAFVGFGRGMAQEGKKEEVEKHPAPTRDSTERNKSFEFLLNKPGSMPAVHLKAKVLAGNQPPLAIIEIAGKEYLVGQKTIIDGATFRVEVVDIQTEELQLKWSPPRSVPMPAKAGPGVKAAMPAITVKGRVIEKNKAPAALLDVGGKLELVAKNRVLSLGGSVTIRIDEVTPTQVRVMLLPQNVALNLH